MSDGLIDNQYFVTSLPQSSLCQYEQCRICNQPAHGNHFGAITCRACAAFFRRALLGKCVNISKCKFNNKNNQHFCAPTASGKFDCKKCRLDRCQKVGMTSKNFQFGRDPILQSSQKLHKSKTSDLRKSVETYLGRPHFIVSMEQKTDSIVKTFIDFNYLIDRTNQILRQGPPIRVLNPDICNLSKMAIGLSELKRPKKNLEIKHKMGKEDVLAIWECNIIQVAQWLVYCDEFQQLSSQLKIQCLQCMWSLWLRLVRIATTAELRRKNRIPSGVMMISNEASCSLDKVNFDVSWFTNYSREQMSFFLEIDDRKLMNDVMDPLMDLQPTNTELTFMVSLICFNVIGKKFQGEVLKMSEKLEEMLTNDLHQYYMNERRMPRYSGRLAQMLKINQIFEKDLRSRRERIELARIFDLFTLELSHPDIFYNM